MKIFRFLGEVRLSFVVEHFNTTFPFELFYFPFLFPNNSFVDARSVWYFLHIFYETNGHTILTHAHTN